MKNINRRIRVILDMDDVLACYVDKVIEEYNKKCNTAYTIEDCTQWDLVGLFGTDIKDCLYREGFFEELEVKNHADKYIKQLVECGRYDVFIATACIPEAYMEKIKWLRKYMPWFDEKRLIPIVEKTAIWGDIIIDDKIENAREYKKMYGRALLYDMAHNRKAKDLDRIYDLENIVDVLDAIFYKDKEYVV